MKNSSKEIRGRLLQWEHMAQKLPVSMSRQEECMDIILSSWQNVSSIADTPSEETASPATELNEQKIYETNNFLLWFESIREQLQICDDAPYYHYLKQLESHDSLCEHTLTQLSEVLNVLKSLREKYEIVSQKTHAFNSVSEELIAQEEQHMEIANEIAQRLNFYTQVDFLEQRLQSPTLSVASKDFRNCLDRIDACLQYLQEHPKNKDSNVYISKYRQCFNRAILQIKNYANAVINGTTEAQKFDKQLNSLEKPGSSEIAFAMYYGKFQVAAAKFKRLSQMVEERIDKSTQYETLLGDLHEIYFSNRASIMTPAIRKGIDDLKGEHKGDHCTLLRSCCSLFLHVCIDEHRLFFQFFTKPADKLKDFLEGLNTILYDSMRPYIIHVYHLETLAEICSILRVEMIEENVTQNPDTLEAFGIMINQLLQDVQERLVYRAHMYLQTDILNYKPSPGDLAYPEKLVMMEDIAMSLQEPAAMYRSDSRASLSSVSSIKDNESNISKPRNVYSPADMHCMWYPPVRRTLVCLSRLYRCVDRNIFQSLSQEALKLCIESVSAASKTISNNKTQIDGELFEIKHLLILREQIAPFRVDFTTTETKLDFSRVKTAALSLLQSRRKLFSMKSDNALLEFLFDGTPQVKEHFLDGRKEIDRQLKHVCEQFIQDSQNCLISPLLKFMERAKNYNAELARKGATASQTEGLRKCLWASPKEINNHISESIRGLKTQLPGLERTMQLYINNRDTEFIIFRSIRNNIIQSFTELENLLGNNQYTAEDMLIIGCPTAEQISILMTSTSILASETTHPSRKNSTAKSVVLPTNMEHAEEIQESVTSTTE